MKNKWRVFFGIIILAMIVYLLRKIDFYEVWNLIVEADNLYFFLAFVSYGASFFVFNARSLYTQRKIVRADFIFNLKTVFAGFFVGTITPGPKVGGDIARAYFLGKEYRKPKSKVLGVILADRVLYVVTSLSFIILSLLFIITYVSISHELKAILQTILFFVVLLFLSLGYVSLRKSNFDIELFFTRIRNLIPMSRAKRFKKTGLEKIMIKHFGHFAKTFRATVRNKKMVFVGILLSLVCWLLVFATSYFLFLSFDVRISFFLVVAVVSIGNLAGDFSPVPGGVGVIEGIMIVLYSIFGIGLSLAFAVSLLTRIIFYFFSIGIGGISLANLEKNIG